MIGVRSLVMVMGLFGLVALAEAQEKKENKKEVVDFRKLKELLPAELSGLKRSEHSGEKVKAGEFTMSMARAEYQKNAEAENAPRIDVTITDYVTNEGIAAGFGAWEQLDIDRETDDGYEKTTKVGGHPAFEKWTKEGMSGDIQIFVAERFLVQVQTSNLPAEQMKKAAEALPLKKLVELGN